jgi:hypothetical protein
VSSLSEAKEVAILPSEQRQLVTQRRAFLAPVQPYFMDLVSLLICKHVLCPQYTMKVGDSSRSFNDSERISSLDVYLLQHSASIKFSLSGISE